MKIQYLGDENDYRKFALLRFLTKHCRLTLGVCWMLTGPDGRTDGSRRLYTQQSERWRSYDPQLFDQLSLIPSRPTRHDLRRLEDFGIAGPRTSYSDAPMCLGLRNICRAECSGSKMQNPCNVKECRRRYMKRSFQMLRNRDLIFFDPDNGIEVPSSTPTGCRLSHKHLLLNEIARFWRNGSSILIYQHLSYEKRNPLIKKKCQQLSEFLNISTGSIQVFLTNRVMFILIPQPRHCYTIRSALKHKWQWPVTFVRSHRGADDLRFLRQPSDTNVPTRNPQSQLIMDRCVVTDANGEKIEINITDALELRSQSIPRNFSCQHCGKPVRPHQAASNGASRAHFEHLEKNPDCFFGRRNWNGIIAKI